MSLRFTTPSEFNDENVWFRFFRMRNLAVMLPCLFFTFILWKVLSLFGFHLIGLVIGGICTVLLTALTMIPAPYDFLKGGSLTLDIIIFRKRLRKRNAVIYVRGYGKDRE